MTCQIIAQPNPKVYKLKVYFKNGKVASGYLQNLNDSSIVISPRPNLTSPKERIYYKSIASLRIRDRKALWKGPVIGAAAGAILGAIIGFVSYEKPDCSGAFICFDFGPEYSALSGATIGGLSGALLGLAIGSSSKEIQLKQNSNSGDYLYGTLSKYVIHPSK
jgi:hypothetical protein